MWWHVCHAEWILVVFVLGMHFGRYADAWLDRRDARRKKAARR